MVGASEHVLTAAIAFVALHLLASTPLRPALVERMSTREPEFFQGGSHVLTYTWNDLTVCPAICYDLRFPELFRKGLKLGAHIFALGANWPSPRQHHWRALAIARAIENQAFVLAVNRTGDDPHLSYTGGTIAVDPKGDILGELTDQPGTLSVEIDPKALHDWRATFPAWKDMRL